MNYIIKSEGAVACAARSKEFSLPDKLPQAQSFFIVIKAKYIIYSVVAAPKAIETLYLYSINLVQIQTNTQPPVIEGTLLYNLRLVELQGFGMR